VWTRGAITTTYQPALACTPKVVYTNGPIGAEGKTGVTGWPSPLSYAATWNLDLSYEKGKAHAQETYETGGSVILGPGLASGRTPLSGRTSEYLGEDSLLGGLTAAETVKGIEADPANTPVFANIKHYTGNEQELDRTLSSSNIDERTFQEVYGLPFEIASEESDPESAMCAYNQINGVWACDDPIMNTHLRAQGEFDGYVMSDFGAVHSTATALKAGMDQELNVPIYYTPTLLNQALEANQITVADIDQAAFRVVRSYIRAGLFDKPLPTTASTNTRTPARTALAKETVEQSAVLLKNQRSVLPITEASGDTIAVIGQVASNTPTGGVSAKTACSYGGSFRPGGAYSSRMVCDGLVDPLTAFTARAAEAGQTVVYADGSDTAAAATLAASADVAIVFGYYTSGEFNDIPDLNFDGNGDALVSAVAAANPKTVVVSETGSAVVMPWLNDVEGVVQAWYAGDQVGPGLASLLWGDTNFSGKLPMTFPKSLADTPTSTPAQYPGLLAGGVVTRPTGSTEIRQVTYSEGREVGYKWYDEEKIDPLFEFGFGLSYTDFDYSDLDIWTQKDAAGALTTTASFTVENTGDVAGAEVPQVYLTLPASADDPGKRLVGFDRVQLAAGASTRVSVEIDSDASNHPYSIWDVASHDWKNIDGSYTVAVGSSSRDIELSAKRSLKFAAGAPVAALAVSPATPNGTAGWYTSDVTVTPTATDDVDASPLVEVNIDDAGWFTAPATLTVSTDGTHTIKARATDDSGNVSAVVTTTVKLDKTKPQAAASSDGVARTITLQASDATSGIARIEYGPAPTTGTEPTSWTTYTAPIAAGRTVQSIVYRAIDNANNASAIARFDYSPTVSVPAVGLTANPSKLAYGKKVTLTAAVPSDAVGLVEFFDGTTSVGTVAVSGGKASVSVSPTAGTHSYTARFTGDPVYSAATSLATSVTVTKATTKATVTTKSIKASSKPKIKATVAKLPSGNYATGTVALYVNGKKVDSEKLTKSDKGKVTFSLKAKRSKSFTVKVKFTPSDSKNVASATSKNTKITVKR
jgi:beta-glucosidase